MKTKSRKKPAKERVNPKLSAFSSEGYVYLEARYREPIGRITTLVKFTPTEAEKLADAIKVLAAQARNEGTDA